MDNAIIPPNILFQKANINNVIEKLDCLCIKKALIQFNNIKHIYNNVILSINISINSIVNNQNKDLVL